MASLDSNVQIRYLVQDDEPQFLLAKKRLREAVRAGETLHIPISVMLELEWVLRSNFKFGKVQVTSTLSALLSCHELSFESETAVEIALALSVKGTADFSDCMHVALAHAAGESPLWTFDRAAAKVDGAKLLV